MQHDQQQALADQALRLRAMATLLDAFAPQKDRDIDALRTSYKMVVAGRDVHDIAQAVANFINNTAVRDSPKAYAPSPAEFAAEIQRIADRRIAIAKLTQDAIRQIEERETHKPGTPESRAEAAKRLLQEGGFGIDETEEERKRRMRAFTPEQLEQHDRLFGVSNEPEAIRARLRL